MAAQASRAAAIAVMRAVWFDVGAAAEESASAAAWASVFPTVAAAERDQVSLLHDIIANPFRPVPPPDASVLAWNEGTVVKLAHAIYEDRAFTQERMGVLADALEDASCFDPDLLGHLRGPGPHTRGCWAVDLLLGKG